MVGKVVRLLGIVAVSLTKRDNSGMQLAVAAGAKQNTSGIDGCNPVNF